MSDKKLKKDSANPALAPKERKIKELQAKIDAGTYKPDPAKIADKMVGEAPKAKPMKKDEMKGEQSEPGDMQMSENAKCKQCGKGEKLCKCDGMMKSEDCKKCGSMHKTADCMKGKSFKQMKDLEKARVDEGMDLKAKVSARQERNDRDVKQTKTPTGQNTRTYHTDKVREKQLESGAERRKGEKIVGEPKEMAEDKSGVHIRGGTYGNNKNVVGGGPKSIGAMSEKGGNKSYRSGGAYHSGGSMGAKMAHDDVMSANKKIKPMLKAEHKPGMSLNDLKKAEQGLIKAEAEAMDLAAEARAALDLIRSKLFPKK